MLESSIFVRFNNSNNASCKPCSLALVCKTVYLKECFQNLKVDQKRIFLNQIKLFIKLLVS